MHIGEVTRAIGISINKFLNTGSGRTPCFSIFFHIFPCFFCFVVVVAYLVITSHTLLGNLAVSPG